jgi:hypothetical protein
MSANVGPRVAAVLLWLNGLGFYAFTPPATRNLLLGREVPLIMGFRAYGGGPFERDGAHTTGGLTAIQIGPFVVASLSLATILLHRTTSAGTAVDVRH